MERRSRASSIHGNRPKGAVFAFHPAQFCAAIPAQIPWPQVFAVKTAAHAAKRKGMNIMQSTKGAGSPNTNPTLRLLVGLKKKGAPADRQNPAKAAPDSPDKLADATFVTGSTIPSVEVKRNWKLLVSNAWRDHHCYLVDLVIVIVIFVVKVATSLMA
ncbi:MAG: hypothetical protein AB1813_03975 [Verrucomicrobiota bacterium]